MAKEPQSQEKILTITCPDGPGIVAAVTGNLTENGANITEAAQFGDAGTGQFFQRIVFEPGPWIDGDEGFRGAFKPIAERFKMNWALHDASGRSKAVIAVSKIGHCLADLLHRHHSGDSAIDIRAVVSNHEDMRDLVEWHGIPYHYLPVTPETKPEQEEKILAVIEETGSELMVLARYMQILTASTSEKLMGRCINIHHAFLPGFKGARPYHRAYERGVKLIGATAHYVTPDLDEGPIIEQAVERVDHAHTPTDLISIGRDIECTVLARAVRWHAERRVLLNGIKTTVFR